MCMVAVSGGEILNNSEPFGFLFVSLPPAHRTRSTFFHFLGSFLYVVI